MCDVEATLIINTEAGYKQQHWSFFLLWDTISTRPTVGTVINTEDCKLRSFQWAHKWYSVTTEESDLQGIRNCVLLQSLHRWESAISYGSRRPQTKTAGAHQWRKASCEFEAERHKAVKEKRRRQKERAASLPSSFQTFVCPKCGRGSASRIGLYSHQRACQN